MPSERCSIEERSTELWTGVLCLVTWWVKCTTPLDTTRPSTIFSQKALGTLSEDGNVMPKHAGATIHN
jgi:hypothetical protein